MSYGNRSKEYDWFKGGKNPNGKDPKSTLKTFWRFTKIFLMFSLFFFSMWGCVQVMVIKTDTHVGDGVEFYNSEEEIAPHVTQFTINNTNKTTNKADDVYSVEVNDENVWLNRNQNKNELKVVQNVLTNNHQTKMSDAVKGKNEYVRIIGTDGGVIPPIGVDWNQSDIVALSSEQKAYNGADGSTIKYIYRGYQKINFTFDDPSEAKNNFALAVLKKIDDATNHSLTTLPTSTEKLAASLLSFDLLGRYLNFNFDKTNKFNVFPDAATPPIGFKSGDYYYNTSATALAGWRKYDGTKWVGTTSPPTTVISTNPLLTGTKYIPIITWKQAWTRGVGPFYGLFVWPISKMGVGITNGMGMHGGWESLFAVVIIVFVLRILGFALTFKSVLQQTKQQEVQSKKAIIDAKYANYKGNKQMESRKRQETADLYKKEGISPLGALGTVFITMPIFLSIWRVIGGTPHLKSTIWLGINFSETSWKKLLIGEWQYLPLIVIAGLSAAFSQIYPRLLTKRRDKNRINVHQKAAMKKNNKTQNIMLVVYIIMAVIFSAGIQIYWIVGGIWQVTQTTITHHILIRSRKKAKNRVKV